MRIRKFPVLALATTLGSLAHRAHAEDDTPKLNSLLTPDSPAFVILGVSPTTIQRPTTPKTVAASLLSAFSSHGRTLVPNYAIEVAPYWIYSHPEKSWNDVAKNSFATPLQTLSVSMATSANAAPASDTMSAASASIAPAGAPRAALGLRTTLITGEVDQVALDKCIKELAKQADATGTEVAAKIADWKGARKSQLSDLFAKAWQAGRKAGLPTPTTETAASAPVLPKGTFPPPVPKADKDRQTTQAEFNELWAKLWVEGWNAGFVASGSTGAPPPPPAAEPAPSLPSDTIDSMTKAAVSAAPTVDAKGCLKAATSREGFVLDAAAATALSFPAGSVNEGKLSTYSVWTTASYLTRNFSALALARLIRDNLDVPHQHSTGLDLGARPIVAVDRFGISVEGVYRVPLTSATSKHQYRVDLAADVELYDGQWFSITGGHDFADGSDWSKFFAIANFKGAFGAGPSVNP